MVSVISLDRIRIGLFAALGIAACDAAEPDGNPTTSVGETGADPALCEVDNHPDRRCVTVEGECPDCSVVDCTVLIYEATLCQPSGIESECGPGVQDNTCCFIVDGDDEVCDGRPFVVHGHKRTASVTQRTDWRREVGNATTREHWIERALDEHASVAAFARFVLELLAVGAPSEFIADAASAMRDEVEHARVCFAIAGHDAGPGPLPTADASVETDLETIARNTLVEGAIGETLAAIRAARDAEREDDPAVRAVLERIAVDETRHAALAWRFVRWAIQQRPTIAPSLQRTFEEALERAGLPEVESTVLRPCFEAVAHAA